MSAMTAAKLTAEEFLAFVQLPENENKWLELDRGDVIDLDRPTKVMSFLTASFAAGIGNYTNEVGGCYAVCGDAGVILHRDPDTVRGSDVAVYDDATSFEELPAGYGEVAPLLAVELLSPTERPMRILRKVVDYLQAGTKLVWLIDPETKTAIVFRPDRIAQVIEVDGTLDCEAVLPGFRPKLADFFLMPHECRPSTLADAPGADEDK